MYAPQLHKYRLTVELGFGLPTVTRHELATSTAEACEQYKARIHKRFGESRRVLAVEDLGSITPRIELEEDLDRIFTLDEPQTIRPRIELNEPRVA